MFFNMCIVTEVFIFVNIFNDIFYRYLSLISSVASKYYISDRSTPRCLRPVDHLIRAEYDIALSTETF